MMNCMTQEMMYLFAWQVVRFLLIAGLGWMALKIVYRLIMNSLGNYGTAHVRMLIGKTVWYSGVMLLAVTLLNELGFHLSALLGAAGVAGVAIGFASQTSMSNLISGLFLLSENFLSIGDTISCGSVFGAVESIDLFSVKVRTFDGRLVRVPNERLIKDDLINVTYYPIRRASISVSVSSSESLERVLNILDEVITHNDSVSKEQKHSFVFDSLSRDALHIEVRVWGKSDQILSVKNSIIEQIKDRFAADKIQTFYVMPKK